MRYLVNRSWIVAVFFLSLVALAPRVAAESVDVSGR
jgi:hypothetical protein